MYKKILFLFVICVYTFAAVTPTVSEDGLSATLTNNTNMKWSLGGIRFKNNGYNWTNIMNVSPDVILEHYNGYQNIYYKSSSGSVYTNVKPGTTASFEHTYVNGVTGATPIAETEFVLLKTGASGIPDVPVSENLVTANQIDSLLLESDFYNANYRYIDSLGGKGGPYSGGFLDTWKGETQLLFPYNGKELTINMTPTSMIADSTNLLYWMTLALGQEFYNVDMQLVAAMAMKETMCGTPLYNAQNAASYGPFQIEASTGLDRALGFPTLFPEYQTQLQNAIDITTSGINVDGFMEHYHNGIVELSMPTVSNSYVLSIVNLYSMYNSLCYAEDICWKDVLDGAADEKFGIGAMLVMYNMGMWSQFGVIAGLTGVDSWEATNSNSDASNLLPPGNSDYRLQISGIIDTLVNTSKSANIDLSIELWDPQIKWSDLEGLFLGTSGTVNSQGTGGLLRHLTVTDVALRTELIGNLETAFNKLKGNALSTIGTENISFRYDFLTLLRSVKKYFSPDVFYKKIYAGDPVTLIAQNSKVGGCGSTGVDTLYPYSTMIYYDVGVDITIDLNLKDDNSIKEVRWTTDSSWSYWHNANYVFGSGGDQNYRIIVPEELKGNVDDGGNLTTDVWYMVTDEAGNSIFKKERFQESVDLKASGLMNSENIKIKNKHNGLFINFSGKSRLKPISIEIFSVNGQRVKSLDNVSPENGLIQIKNENISSGAYIVKIHGNGIIHHSKLNISK